MNGRVTSGAAGLVLGAMIAAAPLADAKPSTKGTPKPATETAASTRPDTDARADAATNVDASAKPDPNAIGLDAWIVRATSALPASPPAQALIAATTAAETSIAATLKEAPWSVRSGIAHGQYFPRPEVGPGVTTFPSPSWDVRGSAELRYQLRSRLLASFAATVSLFDYPGVELGSAPVLPFSAEFQVAYDVIRGSSKSSENERARALAARALAEKLTLEASLVDAELGYLSLVVSLYGNACKRAALEDIGRGVKRSLEEARIQRDAKVMSPADLMNFEHLANLVRVQGAQLALEKDGLLQEAEAWGPEAVAAARSLDGAPLACDATNAPTHPGLAADQAVELARRLPGHGAALAEKWAAALELSATRTEEKASLSPYALGRVSRAAGARDEVATAEVGLALAWDVAGARGDLREKAAVEAQSAAGRRVEQVLARDVSTIRRLTSTLERSQALITALRDTIENSARLEHALDVQRAIGDVAALNQTTAVVNGLTAKLGMVDAWTTASLAARQLALLGGAAERFAPDVARLGDTGWAE